MPLLRRDTGQVSDGRPGGQTVHPIQKGRFLAPPRYQATSVLLTQCIHVHSDPRPCLYIHVHPERPPPTCRLQAASVSYKNSENHLPPAPSAHGHSHGILHTPTPKEHVITSTLAYPETCTHSYSHVCTHNTPTINTHKHAFAHMCLYTDTPHSATSTRTGVAYPDGDGPHESVQSHRSSGMHTCAALPL